jgi:hypothetical protein
MRFTVAVAQNDGWAVDYDTHTQRFSLSRQDDLALSTCVYRECRLRADEKGVVLTPVGFNLGQTPDGKPIKASANLEKGTWILEMTSQEFDEPGSLISAGLARTKPAPRKAVLAQK